MNTTSPLRPSRIRKNPAPKRRDHHRLDYGQREQRRHGGVDGVAARGQHLAPATDASGWFDATTAREATTSRLYVIVEECRQLQYIRAGRARRRRWCDRIVDCLSPGALRCTRARVRASGSAVAPSASWASAGGVRQQGRDPRGWPLTLEAARRWPTLDEELGAPTGFVQGGHLHLAETEAERAALEQRVHNESRAGMNIRMLDSAATYQVVSSLKPWLVGAAYTPDDGQADPRRTTAAFAAAAQRHGAAYFNGSRVNELLESNGRVRGIRVATGDIVADSVVLATGSGPTR